MKLWLIIVISLVVFLALALVVLIFVLWCKKRHWQKMKAAAEKCKRLHFDDKNIKHMQGHIILQVIRGTVNMTIIPSFLVQSLA